MRHTEVRSTEAALAPTERGASELRTERLPDIPTLLGELGESTDRVRSLMGDTYVLEAIEHLDRSGVSAQWFARRCTLLLIKPDAIVACAVEPSFEWLVEHGWQVLHVGRVPAQRHLARALWHDSWASASPERRRLADLLVGICDAVVLVVSDDDGVRRSGAARDVGIEAATIRLTREKGPTVPSARRPGQLRHRLGQHSYLLNLVHTPDTPAEVLREWAIVMDEEARTECLADIVDRERTQSEVRERVTKLAETLYAEAPSRSFERSAAWGRLVADLGATGHRYGDDPNDDAAGEALLTDAWQRGDRLDPWSTIVLGSHVLPMTVDPRIRRKL